MLYVCALLRGRDALSRVSAAQRRANPSGGNDEKTALIPANYQNVASARKGDDRSPRPGDRRREEQHRRHHAFPLHLVGALRRGPGPQGMAAGPHGARDLLTPTLPKISADPMTRCPRAASAMLRRTI